jgi:hypothetical protein
MRMTLFHLALALLLLARGPLCGVVCDLSLFETEVAGTGQHAAPACQESPADETRREPASSHDGCEGCDTLLLATGESPASGPAPGTLVPGFAVNRAASPAQALDRSLRLPPSIGPAPPDILLLKSTLLI